MAIDSKRFSIAVIALGAITVLAALVLGLISRQMPEQAGPMQEQENEKTIVRQQEVYGLSGIIRGVNATDSSLMMETVALPYEGFSPQAAEIWTWRVEVAEGTELVLLGPNEEVEDEEEGEQSHFTEAEASFQDFSVGDRVIVKARENIVLQFPLAEKRMVAEKIQLFKSNSFLQ